MKQTTATGRAASIFHGAPLFVFPTYVIERNKQRIYSETLIIIDNLFNWERIFQIDRPIKRLITTQGIDRISQCQSLPSQPYRNIRNYFLKGLTKPCVLVYGLQHQILKVQKERTLLINSRKTCCRRQKYSSPLISQNRKKKICYQIL